MPRASFVAVAALALSCASVTPSSHVDNATTAAGQIPIFTQGGPTRAWKTLGEVVAAVPIDGMFQKDEATRALYAQLRDAAAKQRADAVVAVSFSEERVGTQRIPLGERELYKPKREYVARGTLARFQTGAVQ